MKMRYLLKGCEKDRGLIKLQENINVLLWIRKDGHSLTEQRCLLWCCLSLS